MSLKRAPRNRSYFSRFLAALIRPFMSERPSQLPQLFFHHPDEPQLIQERVVQWNTHMSQYLDVDGDNTYARCFLQHIEHHKCSDGVGHEFLVFHFTHWDSSATAVVCAERTVHTNDSSRQSGLLCPSLSDDTVAYDTVSIIGSPDAAAAYLKERYPSAKVLCKMYFPTSSRPNTLQVSTILALVNEHSLVYSLYQRQCYWYADTVWRSLKRLFLGNEDLGTHHNLRGHYAGVRLGTSDESVNVVCERYKLAWAQTLEELSQARNRREAQLARIREEGTEEYQRRIEELHSELRREQELRLEQQRRERELRLEQQRRERELRLEHQRREQELRSEQQELRAENERLRAQVAVAEHGTL